MNLIRTRPDGTDIPRPYLRRVQHSQIPKAPNIGDWFKRLAYRLGVTRSCGCNFRLLNDFDKQFWESGKDQQWLEERLAKEAIRLKMDVTPETIHRITRLLARKALRIIDRSPVGS